MSGLEDLVQAAMSASPERRLEALRILRGDFPASSEPYLTLRAVASRLSLNPATLWRWKIPGHRFGGHRRYRMSEVIAYLGSQEFRRHRAALRAARKRPRRETQHELISAPALPGLAGADMAIGRINNSNRKGPNGSPATVR
jgi:hypothetical protein